MPQMPPRPARRRHPTHFAALATLFARRGAGAALAFSFLGATLAYAATLGGHWPAVHAAAFALPDGAARAAGFRITSIDVEGRSALTDREILEALEFGAGRSLLFLDATVARAQLMQNPLVLDATVRKLYPDRLAVSLVERQPYALWQRDGQLLVMALDGTIIDLARDGRFADLPLLVGKGAETAAPEILAVLDQNPGLAAKTYAAVRVGGRRWNLRLTNGVDVKLPEQGLAEAVARFTAVDAAHKLDDRDIVEIDLRVPARSTVRLSDAAAAAEAEALKKAKKGGST